MRAILALASAGLRGRSRTGTAVLLAVLTIAATGLAAGLSVARGGENRLDELAARTNVPDVVLWTPDQPLPAGDGPSGSTRPSGGSDASGGGVGPEDGSATLLDVPGVRAAIGPQAVVAGELVTGSRAADVEAVSVAALDDPVQPVGGSRLIAGRWVAGPDELVVERSAAASLDLAPGSTVTLRVGAGSEVRSTEVRFTVVGTGTDLTDCGFPDCDPVRMFASTSGLHRLDPTGAASSHRYLIDTEPRTDAEELAGRLLRDHPDLAEATNTWPDTRGDILTASRIFGLFVVAFGVFLLVACAVVVAGALVNRIVRQRREIAVLGAVGYRPRQIVAALVGEHLALGVPAAVLGWLVGSLVTPALDLGAAPLAGRPDPAWSVADLILTAGTLGAVLVVATVGPAVRAARAPVTEGLRDSPRTGRGWSWGPATRVPTRLGLLGLGPLAARPARTGLSALAVVVAVVGIVVTGGFLGTVDRAASEPFETGSPWDITVGAAEGIRPAVRTAPGVASWYAEADRAGSVNGETVLTRAFEGGPPAYRLGAGRLPRAAGEVAVGYGLVANHGVDVGATLSFEVTGAAHAARVVGWYRTTEDTGDILLLPMAELRRTEPGAVAEVLRLTARPGTDPALLADELGDLLGPGAAVEVQDSSTTGLAIVRAAMLTIAGLVAAVALVNLLSTLLSGNRENARALGVLGALGFAPRQLVGQGAVAGAALGGLGLLVGVPLGLACFRLLSDLVTTNIGMGPGYAGTPGVAMLPGLIAIPLAGAVAGGLAARVLALRPVAALLRWE